MKHLIIGLAVVVVLVGAGYVEGAIIVGHFHGTITDSQVWANTFGLPEGIDTINGMEIFGNIAYDTALAPSDKDPDPRYGVYQTVDDSVIWMQLNPVTIGGTLITIPAFPDPIVTRDADQLFQVNVPDGIVHYTRDLDYNVGGGYVEYSVDWQLIGGSLSDVSLPLSLDLADFTRGFGNFYMDDLHGGGRVHANFELDTLSVSPIPEPSTLIIWLLLGAIGITVGWWLRRRKAA